MKRIILFSICLFLGLPFAFSQKESKDVRKGNDLYKNNRFTDAEVFYRKGLGKNNKSFEANFNLGNALYKQKKHDDAIKEFEKASTLEKDKEKQAAAYHNIGNAYFQQKKYDKSIEAYKNALKKQPKDKETRYNLAVAKKYLQQQQQQQQPKDQDQEQDNNMSQENANQILQALAQDEKEVQKKVKKQKSSRKPPVEKDW